MQHENVLYNVSNLNLIGGKNINDKEKRRNNVLYTFLLSFGPETICEVLKEIPPEPLTTQLKMDAYSFLRGHKLTKLGTSGPYNSLWF